MQYYGFKYDLPYRKISKEKQTAVGSGSPNCPACANGWENVGRSDTFYTAYQTSTCFLNQKTIFRL